MTRVGMGSCQDFRKMHGAAGCILGDLFAAAEAVGDEDCFPRCTADGREENAFTNGLGDFEFFTLEAEGAGHAAAAGVEEGDGGAGAAEEVDFGGYFEDGFVVAVAVDEEAAAGKVGRLEMGRVADEEFAEEEGLGAEALGARAGW